MIGLLEYFRKFPIFVLYHSYFVFSPFGLCMTPYLQQRTLYPPQILKRPPQNLGMVVVIPAYDEDYLLLSLLCLKKCDLPTCDVEVLIVLNDSERDTTAVKQKHQKQYLELQAWAKKVNKPRLRFQVLYCDNLPPKHAGVGLARKIGMDEAAWRLERAGNRRGIIVCFDADSRCERNYLQSIEQHFQQHPKTQACGLYFEHPLYGCEYPEKVYEAILAYELHLRYSIHAQRFAGFPFAYYTIGSSMAVRADAYQQQGGMNQRKAEEDFYFLHTYIELERFSEITATKVIPSARPSHRVPFGTGKAVQELLGNKESYLTYHPQSFLDLKCLFSQLPNLFAKSQSATPLPASIQDFLQAIDFSTKLEEIRQQTPTLPTFTTQFFCWFNAGMVMKFVHFARDKYYKNQPIEEAARWLLQQTQQLPSDAQLTPKELLIHFRQLDRRSY